MASNNPNASGSVWARFASRLHDYWVAPYRTERVMHYHLSHEAFSKVPLRLAALSDFHSGPPFMPADRLRRIINTTHAAKPDLILLPGDFFAEERGGQRPLSFETLAGLLATLRAPLGVFAVLGNHDWWDDREAQARRAGPVRWAGVMRDIGITVLENQSVSVRHHDVVFDLAGLGDQEALKGRNRKEHVGVHDLEATLTKCRADRFTLLLAHQPDIFPEAARHPIGVDLTISGHTHAGQIQVLGRPVFVPSDHGRDYAHGLLDINGRKLIVSSGLGCSRIPVRLGVVPEITVIDLTGP